VPSPEVRYRFKRLAVILHGLIGFSLLGMSALAVGQTSGGPGAAQNFSQSRPLDPLNAVAFDRFYNLDYDRAVPAFQKILERHPDDPFAVNHLLAAVMYRELYRMGLLDPGD